MCSRFELKANSREVGRRFGLTIPPPMPLAEELRPTDSVLVIGPNGAEPMAWGLAVDWLAAPLINARAETLTDKPTFRPLLAHGRVLVPATTWWEWPVVGRGKRKTRIALASGEVFAFAGLSDGKRVVIVTCAPTRDLADFNDRMPVVLAQGCEAAWIDPGRSFPDVASLLGPLPGPFAVTAELPPPSAQGDLFG